MKKISKFFVVVVMALVLAGPSWAGEDTIMSTTVLFSAYALTGSGNITSSAIDLNGFKNPIQGFFALTVTTASAGAAVAKVEYLICDTVDGTYITPSSASDIVTAHAVGADIYSFEPVVGKFMKFKITETAAVNITLFSLVLTVN